MKKIIILAAILGTVAFGAQTAAPTSQTQQTTENAKMGKHNNGNMKKGNKMMGNMIKFLSEKDQETLTKNRNEIFTQIKSENSDWNKVQKLSDESSLIMSKGRTAMLKESKEQGKMRPVKNESKEQGKKDSKEQGKMKKGNHEGKMKDAISKNDQATLEKNKNEINAQIKLENPDWNKVQKLSDESALIMSKGATEMMKKKKAK